MRYFITLVTTALLCVTTTMSQAAPKSIELTLQTRDPKTGKVATRKATVDPRTVGIVVVDPWNYHWCMTWTHQTASAVPRLNRIVQGARRMGIKIIWAPSDVAGMYVGRSQRERALAVPYLPVPAGRGPSLKFTVPTGPCHCGPGISCQLNYGFDAMLPDLDIADEDLIICGTQEMYSNSRAHGLKHLIYTGGATNICLTGKPAGLLPMARAGLDCMIARDLSEAWTRYDPNAGYTPDEGNAHAVADVERSGVPSVNLGNEMKTLGLWDDSRPVDAVRMWPWGKRGRPYAFEGSVAVTLTAPWIDDAELRFTTDGSEPSPESKVYTTPLALTETTTLRAAAFRDGRRVSIPSQGYFVRLPAVPPKPDIYLDGLPILPDPYGQIGAVYAACQWQPKVNHSYEDKPLRIRGTKYEHGLGMRAPGNARYAIKPQYKRFVALVGIDDNMLDRQHGRSIAMHASVVFKVFIDGRLAAESPVMRISAAPWRFDVLIPAGTRQVNLVATDAGSRSAYDLGNWPDAGFVLKR